MAKLSELKAYFTEVLKATLLDLALENLAIDGIHKLPKSKHIPAHLPRDMIASIHYFQTNEKLLAAFRNVAPRTPLGLISVYQPLCPYFEATEKTGNPHQAFKKITKFLINGDTQRSSLLPKVTIFFFVLWMMAFAS